MTKELFDKACEFNSEIEHINMLINYVEKCKDSDILMDPKYNDFAYLVYLIGVNNALGYMRRRKKMLEKEFEEL